MDLPGEVRRVINFKRLAITDFKIDIPRSPKKSVLKAALEKDGRHSSPGSLGQWGGMDGG